MKMREILNRRRLAELELPWKMFARTNSRDSTFAFDRFRIYGDVSKLKIGIFRNVNTWGTESGEILEGEFISEQPFHIGGGWTTAEFEHDFTFNLSGEVGLITLAIKGFNPNTHKCAQVYGFPTGYGDTRNKNTLIEYWNFHIINPDPTADITGISRFRMNHGEFYSFEAPSLIKTAEFNIQNARLTSAEINDVLIFLNNNRQSNGTLNYSNNWQNPSLASRAAYDSLISKGWTITGTPPPIS